MGKEVIFGIAFTDRYERKETLAYKKLFLKFTRAGFELDLVITNFIVLTIFLVITIC